MTTPDHPIRNSDTIGNILLEAMRGVKSSLRLTEANLAALAERNVTAYLTRTRQASRRRQTNVTGPLTNAMRDKLKRAGWRSRYRLRKQIVETGQI